MPAELPPESATIPDSMREDFEHAMKHRFDAPHTRSDVPADVIPRPILDGIVIHQVMPNDKLGSGLLVRPQKFVEWPQIGTVVRVGPGRIDLATGERIPMSVKEGDEVLFARRGDSEMRWLWMNDSDRWLLLHDDDMLAIVELDA